MATTDAEEKPKKVKNKRCYCTLSPVTIARLEALAVLGTHGDDNPGVMAHLIQTGIQVAIERGYIPKEVG